MWQACLYLEPWSWIPALYPNIKLIPRDRVFGEVEKNNFIKKAECRRIDAFELWCWRRLLRVPWATRRSNQSILKISPGCSLEGLMLKLKFQYFCYVMWRTDSLEKTLMLGGIGGRRRREWQRMRWLVGIPDSMDMSLGKLQVNSCHLLFDHFQFALIHGPNIPGSYAILLFTASDFSSVQVLSRIWLFVISWTAEGKPAFPVHHQLPGAYSNSSTESVMPSNRLILCHPLLMPSIFPSIRVFPNKSVLRISGQSIGV